MNRIRCFTLVFALPLLFAGCASDPAKCPAATTPTEAPPPASELHPQSVASLGKPLSDSTETVLPEGIIVRELQYESEAGHRNLRLYSPVKKSAHPRSAVLFLHGADRNTARFCAGLALKADVTVAAPDLRVAPEAPWPAALEDALSAYNHLCTNADDLGVNPERIVPGGDGAGALLALALVRNEYETTGEKPAGLLLFYPLLAPEGENRGESWKRYATEFGLDAEAVTAFVDDWIADAEDRKNASPFRAGTEGVPPTLLVVAGCDVLRDQGLAFAAKLRQANVPVRIRRYNGAIHGFLTRPGLDVFFRQGVEDAASFLGGLPGGK